MSKFQQFTTVNIYFSLRMPQIGFPNWWLVLQAEAQGPRSLTYCEWAVASSSRGFFDLWTICNKVNSMKMYHKWEALSTWPGSLSTTYTFHIVHITVYMQYTSLWLPVTCLPLHTREDENSSLTLSTRGLWTDSPAWDIDSLPEVNISF